MTSVEVKPAAISRGLLSAAQDVFASMVGVSVEESPMPFEFAASQIADGVMSLIGLTGVFQGTGSLSCSSSVACDLASRFLMMEATTVNDEVLDAIGELTNMIIGGAKNLLEDEFGPVQMSIPATVHGENICMRNIGGDVTVPVRLVVASGDIVVAICFATK